MTTDSQDTFCSWGMYAITDELRASWSALHEQLIPHLANYAKVESTLRFDTDETTLRDQRLLIGQTCGYPLVKHFRDVLQPLCVPVFEIDGCDGPTYSSVILVHADSGVETLENCAGKVVAINDVDSNSGMNLLRTAIQPLLQGKSFFDKTIISGSHLASVQAISERQADVASVDCVTFAFIKERFPELAKSVRCIGFTPSSTGLPFVTNVNNTALSDSGVIASLFNRAYSLLADVHRERLRIREFSPVSLEDYDSIAEMESAAQHLQYVPEAL